MPYDLALIAAAIATAAGLLWLGRDLSFSTWGDDWATVAKWSLDEPVSFVLRGQNEHWVAVPMVVLRMLVETVGISSYLPFHALLVASHLAIVAGVYVLARASTHGWLAFAMTLPVLVLGAGVEMLLVSFQVTNAFAIAFGVWAIVAYRRDRPAIAAVLLVLGVASSSPALFFAAWLGVEAVVRRDWRGTVAAAVPVATWAAWRVLVHPPGATSSIGFAPADPLTFVAVHLQAIAAALFAGGERFIGLELALLVLGTAAIVARRRLADPRILGPAAGLAAAVVATTVARASLGIEAATWSRYVYTGVVILVPLLAALVARPELAQGRRRALAIIGVVALVTVSLTGNARAMASGYAAVREGSDQMLSVVALVMGGEGPDDRTVYYVPPRPCLEVIVARYGAPSGSPDPRVLEAARRAVVDGISTPTLPVITADCDPAAWPGLR